MQSRLADAEASVTAAQDAAAAADKRTARLREAAANTDARLHALTAENSDVRFVFNVHPACLQGGHSG